MHPNPLSSSLTQRRFIKIGTLFELLGHVSGRIDVGVEIDTHVVYGLEKGMWHIVVSYVTVTETTPQSYV